MPTPRAETGPTAGPLRLRTYTCLGCGHRSASWAAFRDHRRRCKGFSALERPAGEDDAEESGAAPPES